MEIIVWLGVMVLVALAVTLSAPYHIRLIENRPKVDKAWD
jgi:hypothetical protein